MSDQKTVKYTMILSKERGDELNFLQNLYGLSTLKEFFSLSMTLMKLVANGILDGKQLALIDQKTGEPEIITHEYFERIEKIRDEKM